MYKIFADADCAFIKLLIIKNLTFASFDRMVDELDDDRRSMPGGWLWMIELRDFLLPTELLARFDVEIYRAKLLAVSRAVILCDADDPSTLAAAQLLRIFQECEVACEICHTREAALGSLRLTQSHRTLGELLGVDEQARPTPSPLLPP